MPGSLTAAIADRIGFLSTATREVLRAAALLGVEFAVPDLTTVLGKSVADVVPALDEARSTGVLTDSANGFLAFRHPLIREALYAELPGAVRGAWHRDAGHALALRARPRTASPGSCCARWAGSPATGLPPSRMTRRSRSSGRRWRLGPAVGGPMDQWMLDWLTTSADSLVGQAPGVASELLEPGGRRASSPARSNTAGWPAGWPTRCTGRATAATAARVAERALGYSLRP